MKRSAPCSAVEIPRKSFAIEMDFTPNRLSHSNMSLNVSFESQEGSSCTNFNGSNNKNKQLKTSECNNCTQEITTQNKSNISNNSLAERIHFFTGTVEKVLAWNRVLKQRCYFEVIALVVSVQNSQNDRQTILLKDKKGPILQVIRYLNHDMELTEFSEGQMLRCVGYMTGVNTLTAVNIRKATTEEIATLQRYCYIGDFTVSGLINTEENL